jgi:hypothetical protein
MSILSTSPNSTRHFDMEIADALGSMEAAVILQQLHYWTQKEGIGVIVDNAKYIYNTFKDWVSQQFRFLTEWKFRKAMDILRSLNIVKVIRYKSKEWNQTNYYSLNYTKLREWAKAESIEISELRSSTPQGEGTQSLEMRDTKVSLYETKNTIKEEATEQFAAASLKKALEGDKEQKNSNPHIVELNTFPGASTARRTARMHSGFRGGQNTLRSEQNKSNTGGEKNVTKVDCIVNFEWEKLIPELDGSGIPINRTIKDLLKLYPREKVEGAIALVKVRKRSQYIPNMAGYFVTVLKGDWAGKQVVESGEGEIDQGVIFRHWYDLARELGYCSGQEVRDGEQWVNLSGAWETWEDAIARGYSLEYLKRIMKRNRGS